MRHWVLIETSANQAYIFDTNRLRHVVGASYLVYVLGTEWVPQAARSHGARVVLAISGKALLLVTDPAAGRAVIGEVSARALRQAPGLTVTGVVGPGFDPAADWRPDGGGSAGATSGSRPPDHVEALANAYHLLDVVRQARPSPRLRDQLLPWFEVCRDSGYPAAGLERHAEGGPAAASVLAKSDVRRQARERMRGLLRDLPDLVPADLDDLRHDGWIAVIHADGNAVGRVFTQFPERALRATEASGGARPGLSLDRHAELLADFTLELDMAARTALGVAVRDATAGQDAAGTILPVVVGGDDVTLVCHASLALPLVRAFAVAFAEQTAAQPTVRAITGSGLTAAAGIAYVKPHHPFSAAYGLAEELTASAKSVNAAASLAGDRELSAVDLHVAFESTLADLAELRMRLATAGLARHGGPYVIPTEDDQPVSSRDIAELDRTLRTVRALSSSMAHDLREGLAVGPDEYALRIRRAARSPDLPADVRPADIEHLAPATTTENGARDHADDYEGERAVRLLDALLLDSISQPVRAAATAQGRDRNANDVEVPA